MLRGCLAASSSTKYPEFDLEVPSSICNWIVRVSGWVSEWVSEWVSDWVSVGCFTPYRQLGLFSRGKQVWTYSVLDENKFGLFQSWVIKSMRWNSQISKLYYLEGNKVGMLHRGWGSWNILIRVFQGALEKLFHDITSLKWYYIMKYVVSFACTIVFYYW